MSSSRGGSHSGRASARIGHGRTGSPHETEDGGVVWELFVVEAPAPSPSARRDVADGHWEEQEGPAVAAALSPSYPASPQRPPAARQPAVAPEVDTADDDGFDWDQGDGLPF